MLAKVQSYQSQTFDCYGVKVHPWDLTNIFQPFVHIGGLIHLGDYYETRSDAEKAAEELALKWEGKTTRPTGDSG